MRVETSAAALSSGVPRGQGGRADSEMGAAAADIAVHRPLDLLCRRAGIPLEEAAERHDLSGGAEPALKSIVLHERVEKRVRILNGSFDRFHRAAIGLDGQEQARQHGPPIEEHGAGAARADPAAFFGTREMEIISKQLQQRAARDDRDVARLAIDDTLHPVRWIHGFLQTGDVRDDVLDSAPLKMGPPQESVESSGRYARGTEGAAVRIPKTGKGRRSWLM